MAPTGSTSSTPTKQDLDKLTRLISSSRAKPFLVMLERLSGSGTEVNVHLAKQNTKRSFSSTNTPADLKRHLSQQISALGFDAAIRIKLHRRRALDRARSLETFVAQFGMGQRLYDPSGMFHDAYRLVGFARELRRQLEDDLTGIYWSSRWRTIYVLLNQKRFVAADGYCLRRDRLIAAERAVIAAHEADGDVGVSRNVRLCFDLPAVPLVPVDDASFTENIPGMHVRTPPRVLKLAILARVPLLSALFGIGSAGIALAKLPPVENRPLLTGFEMVSAAPRVAGKEKAGHEPTAGHLDRIDGAVSAPGVSEPLLGFPGPRALSGTQLKRPKTNALPDGEEGISRDYLLEVSKSGATFGALAKTMYESKIDLRWGVLGGNIDTNAPNMHEATAFPAMQPGIMAFPGLSRLVEIDLSDAAYGNLLEDMQVYFGLPESLREEARWHFGGARHSAEPSRNRNFFDRKVFLAQAESYWEWLRRMGPRNQPDYNDRRYRSTPSQGPTRAPADCSSSSC